LDDISRRTVTSSSEQTKGTWYTALAYALWGFFPIYWKFLGGISALQLTCHRIVWSFAVLVMMIAGSNGWHVLRQAISARRSVAVYSVAAVVIALNWLIFVWAVEIGQIVQISLGYFVNPLLSVVLGVLFFRERLRPLQWVSVVLAGVAVLYLTIAVGAVPWIGLSLAAAFGTYGLLKKIAPLGAVHGLTLETGILVLPAAAWLAAEEAAGRGALFHSGTVRDLLMFGAGPVTTFPLLLFAAGVRRIPLSVVGMLQYINPTMQILTAVFVYHEPFSRAQLIGFSLVWAALALFAVESYLARWWPQLAITDI
jgi:chloramphenicol-sensitive protein RarD